MNDSINRKGAINAVCTVLYPDADKMNDAKKVLKEMPSAQPESHDKRTETHACDLISRQRAIDAFDCTDELIVSGEANAQNVAGYINKVIGKIETLPSAQPEVIRCKYCKDYQTDWETSYPNRHYCATMDSFMPEDGFCNYAERREDEGVL